MNYYDEFGLSQNASAEEIKDAYRALMRLLHPDHQSEKHLQQVAESQVKKLNHIYGVLSDPVKRRQYDRDLSEGPERAQPIIIHAPPPPRKSFLNTGSLAWVTAVALFGVLLVWMASRPSPTVPNYGRDSGSTATEGSRTGANGRPAPESSEMMLPTPPPIAKHVEPSPSATAASAAAQKRADADAEALRRRLMEAMNERDAAQAELARVQSRAEKERMSARVAATSQRVNELKRASVATPSALALEARQEARNEQRNESKLNAAAQATSSQQQPVLVAKALPPPPEIQMRNPISGSWVYRKPETPPKNKMLYPPEFIETVITEENGQVRGTYHARYKAPDKPVSPEVSFVFSGKINGDSGIFPWNGAGGARGEVTLKLTADHALRVDWTASQLGALGFYRGTAVLVKRD